MTDRPVDTMAEQMARLLVQLRRRRGWSQETLSFTSIDKGQALSRSTIQRMERGEVSAMSLENFCCYCITLGLDPIRLLPISADNIMATIDGVERSPRKGDQR